MVKLILYEDQSFKRISDISEQMDGGTVILTVKLSLEHQSLYAEQDSICHDAEEWLSVFSKWCANAALRTSSGTYQKYLIDLPEEPAMDINRDEIERRIRRRNPCVI